jgi:hypothetical protein
MTITLENENDVIVYALEKIISYARDNQYIFFAQSVWWIASIIGLQSGLIIHIDNLKGRSNTGIDPTQLDQTILKESSNIDIPIHPSQVAQVQTSDRDYRDSEGESICTTETDIHNELIDNREAFPEQSKQERESIGRFAW